jgi:hypothetical protein
LVQERFLHQLRIDLHLDQDISERPSESVESESTRRSHGSRLLGGHAQVIGNQHVGRRRNFSCGCATRRGPGG